MSGVQLSIQSDFSIMSGVQLSIQSDFSIMSDSVDYPIRFDDPTIQPLPATDKAIGIDLGISSLVITSDGDKVSNPKHFKKHYRRLQKAQKSLSRKQKGSKNREKARIKNASMTRFCGSNR